MFEMLTGKRLFDGATVSDTLAAVLRAEIDWSDIPAETPAAIRKLLRRSLERESKKRLRWIGDATLEIEEALAGEPAEVKPIPAAHRRGPWTVAIVWSIALAVVMALWWPRPPVEKNSIRVSVEIAPGRSLPMGLREPPVAALSPDGKMLAYVAASGGDSSLYLRPLDRLDATALSGTEGASNPFFSPDGAWIGFFASGKLMKISVSGGAPVSLCDAGVGRGATWSEDGISSSILR